MKAHELIEALGNCDQDMEVFFVGNGCTHDITVVKIDMGGECLLGNEHSHDSTQWADAQVVMS